MLALHRLTRLITSARAIRRGFVVSVFMLSPFIALCGLRQYSGIAGAAFSN